LIPPSWRRRPRVGECGLAALRGSQQLAIGIHAAAIRGRPGGLPCPPPAGRAGLLPALAATTRTRGHEQAPCAWPPCPRRPPDSKTSFAPIPPPLAGRLQPSWPGSGRLHAAAAWRGRQPRRGRGPSPADTPYPLPCRLRRGGLVRSTRRPHGRHATASRV
jgi:hypothetical protein